MPGLSSTPSLSSPGLSTPGSSESAGPFSSGSSTFGSCMQYSILIIDIEDVLNKFSQCHPHR